MADDDTGQGEVGIWDQTTQAVGEVWDTATETAERAWDGAAGTAEQAWDTATEAAGETWDTATEVAGQAWDTAAQAAAQAWTDVAGGQPASGPSAVSDHEFRRPLSEFELQVLAGDPPRAKTERTTLGEGERALLRDFMASIWGADFVQAFETTPADLTHDRDTINNITPSDVESRGFRFARVDGDDWLYFHPSGRSFHLRVQWPEDGEPPDDEPSDDDAPDAAEPDQYFLQAANFANIVESLKVDVQIALDDYLQHRHEPGDRERYQTADATNTNLAHTLNQARELFDVWRDNAPDGREDELEQLIFQIELVGHWHNEFGPWFFDQMNADDPPWPDE